MRLGPGLSFSWRRALGVSALKHHIARRTGIPTTRSGSDRRIGRFFYRRAPQPAVRRPPMSRRPSSIRVDSDIPQPTRVSRSSALTETTAPSHLQRAAH